MKRYDMKSLLGITLLLLVSMTLIEAQSDHDEPMNQKQIKHMDRVHTAHKAHKRNFRTKKEFERKRHPTKNISTHKRINKHDKNDHRHIAYSSWQGYGEIPYGYERPHAARYIRGYRHPKRGWILAYRYDRADFYDQDGFYYGYFNRYGYYFEGIFYRYDPYYTYYDRIRGRGLFDRYYYPPAAYRYYGFCL